MPHSTQDTSSEQHWRHGRTIQNHSIYTDSRRHATTDRTSDDVTRVATYSRRMQQVHAAPRPIFARHQHLPHPRLQRPLHRRPSPCLHPRLLLRPHVADQLQGLESDSREESRDVACESREIRSEGTRAGQTHRLHHDRERSAPGSRGAKSIEYWDLGGDRCSGVTQQYSGEPGSTSFASRSSPSQPCTPSNTLPVDRLCCCPHSSAASACEEPLKVERERSMGNMRATAPVP